MPYIPGAGTEQRRKRQCYLEQELGFWHPKGPILSSPFIPVSHQGGGRVCCNKNPEVPAPTMENNWLLRTYFESLSLEIFNAFELLFIYFFPL